MIVVHRIGLFGSYVIFFYKNKTCGLLHVKTIDYKITIIECSKNFGFNKYNYRCHTDVGTYLFNAYQLFTHNC